MSKRSFYIRACWDDEAKVYYSESDITGLHIEAESLEEFESVMMEAAIELIIANHVSLEDLATKSMKELLPSILWQRPEHEMACA